MAASNEREDALADLRWKVLLPVVFITYSLAYLDRANYAFGAAAGMAKDLGVTAGASSLAAALFFLGYFLFQVPSSRLAERTSLRWTVFLSLLGWAALAACTGLIHSLGALYAVRFGLGVLESVVMPCLLMLLARWFTARERARANTLLILGNPVTVLWMSVLSGYLAQGLGWRAMFIAEGLPALPWALVWLATVADRPTASRWLSKPRAQALEAQIAAEQVHIQPVKSWGALLRSPVTLLLTAQYLTWSVGVYGFVLWLPSMLKQARTPLSEVGWLAAGPYLGAIVSMLVCSTLSDRAGRRKAFIAPCLLLGAAAFYGSYLATPGHYWLSYGLLVAAGAAMYAPYGPFFAHVVESVPQNAAGGVIAIVNASGALGSFAGSYAVGLLNAATGGPGVSYLLLAAALAISGAITFALKTPSRPAGPAAATALEVPS